MGPEKIYTRFALWAKSLDGNSISLAITGKVVSVNEGICQTSNLRPKTYHAQAISGFILTEALSLAPKTLVIFIKFQENKNWKQENRFKHSIKTLHHNIYHIHGVKYIVFIII